MKESGSDHVVTGFKLPGDGWHIVEFGEGIDFLTGKGGEGIYQNERGFRTYKLPAKIKDENDVDNDVDVSQLVGTEKGGGWLANILACVGLWDGLVKAFPGDDVSVFDQPIIDKIKIKLPGKSCMMRTEVGKDSQGKDRTNVREMASFVKYKEILAEAPKGGSGKKGAGKKEGGAAGEAPPKAPVTGTDW